MQGPLEDHVLLVSVIFVLTQAQEFQLDYIIFFTNSLEVAHAIEGSENWSLKSFVVNILELHKSFASIKIRHFLEL